MLRSESTFPIPEAQLSLSPSEAKWGGCHVSNGRGKQPTFCSTSLHTFSAFTPPLPCNGEGCKTYFCRVRTQLHIRHYTLTELNLADFLRQDFGREVGKRLDVADEVRLVMEVQPIRDLGQPVE